MGGREDGDGIYVVPEELLKNVDCCMSYGIADDISFEDQFSLKYNKPVYAFDGSIIDINRKSSHVYVFREFIGNNKHAWKDWIKNELTFGRCNTFSNHIRDLNLLNKNILLKMDIEGTEYDVMDDVLLYSKNIPIILIEFHKLDEDEYIPKAVHTFEELLKHNYICISAIMWNHSKKKSIDGIIGDQPRTMIMTYVCKNIVDEYELTDQIHPAKQEPIIKIPYRQFKWKILL